MADKEKSELESGKIGLGTLLEVGLVIANSTKNKPSQPDGTGGGWTLDVKKLSWGLVGIVAQQVISGFTRRQKLKTLNKDLTAGLITEEDYKAGRRADSSPQKKSRFGLGLLIGAATGGVSYLLAMTPEERSQFFKRLEKATGGLTGIFNDLQGKPYSEDYEPK